MWWSFYSRAIFRHKILISSLHLPLPPFGFGICYSFGSAHFLSHNLVILCFYAICYSFFPWRMQKFYLRHACMLIIISNDFCDISYYSWILFLMWLLIFGIYSIWFIFRQRKWEIGLGQSIRDWNHTILGGGLKRKLYSCKMHAACVIMQ